jgi:hypothetical protein
MARSVIDDLGFSRLPLWDTEVNYGNRRDNGHPEEVFCPKLGAAYLARTYIDSLRYGVSKVFWYAWESQVMGISTTRAVSGNVMLPGTAFFTIQEWLDGAAWGSCRDGVVTICNLKRSGKVSYLLYTTKGKRTVSLPKARFDVRRACTLDGKCDSITGRKLTVDRSPVLVTP